MSMLRRDIGPLLDVLNAGVSSEAEPHPPRCRQQPRSALDTGRPDSDSPARAPGGPGRYNRSQMRRRFLAFAGGLLVLAGWVSVPRAQAPSAAPCNVTTTERVVAIGDVHGAYDQFVAILRAAGLVNTRDRWSGGRAVLVQTGDILDRGKDSRKVIELLRRLEREARGAGGQVIALDRQPRVHAAGRRLALRQRRGVRRVPRRQLERAARGRLRAGVRRRGRGARARRKAPVRRRGLSRSSSSARFRWA